VKRGEIWTVSGGSGYAGKPRPAVIVQENHFTETNSITICGFTTNPTDAPLLRLPVTPSDRNGLRSVSRLMVDKITTVPKNRIGDRIGQLDESDLARLNQAMTVFLGLAGSTRTGR
jgi:mRNA interferase MazF